MKSGNDDLKCNEVRNKADENLWICCPSAEHVEFILFTCLYCKRLNTSPP